MIAQKCSWRLTVTATEVEELRLGSFIGLDLFMNMIQQIQFGRLFPKMQKNGLDSLEGVDELSISSRSPHVEDETEVAFSMV